MKLGKRRLSLLVILFLAMIAGCTTLAEAPPKWPWVDHPQKGEVAQVMALWADGVVVHPDPLNNGAPTPGVSGRIYLFGQNLGEPLAADGKLSVHLYDDTQARAERRAPREVWNIDQAGLDKVLKKDGLGWGYNLWLPWSEYRPEIGKVCLIVKYESRDGKEAWSGHTTMMVRGNGGLKTASRVETTKGRMSSRQPATKTSDE